MTGLVRKATLLGVCGLLASSVALANVPDPARSTIPSWIFVVGKLSSPPGPDAFGQASVTVRDFSNNPIAGALVTIDFSQCCDINLCDAGVGHNACAETISGLTNGSGVFTFIAEGAANDPIPPLFADGCRYPVDPSNGSVVIKANSGTGDVVLGSVGAVTLDYDGNRKPTAGSNGTTGADVSACINIFGQVFGGAQPYQGRGDVNTSASITGADVSSMITQFGRIFGSGTLGCTGAYCPTKPSCP